MEGLELLAPAESRQAQVDAVLDRFFSLTRKRAAPLGPEYVALWGALEGNTNGGKRMRPRMVFAAYALRTELHPLADTVLRRAK